MSQKNKILLDLLDRSGPKLMATLNRLVLDEQTTEDLIQELFVRLYDRKDLLQIKNLQAYAFRTAINLAFDYRRDQKRRRIFAVEELPAPKLPPAGLAAEEHEQLERILDTAETLEGLTRECFVLHYVEQMEYPAIAERLDKTPKQVRALCSKALTRIRQMLNKQSGNPSLKEANHG